LELPWLFLPFSVFIGVKHILNQIDPGIFRGDIPICHINAEPILSPNQTGAYGITRLFVTGFYAFRISIAHITHQRHAIVRVSPDKLCGAGFHAFIAFGSQAKFRVKLDAIGFWIFYKGFGRGGTGFYAGAVIAMPADNRHINNPLVLEYMNTGHGRADNPFMVQTAGIFTCPAPGAVLPFRKQIPHGRFGRRFLGRLYRPWYGTCGSHHSNPCGCRANTFQKAAARRLFFQNVLTDIIVSFLHYFSPGSIHLYH
jgi:hypothetical protein